MASSAGDVNVEEIFQKYLEGSSKGYDAFISKLADPEIESALLSSYLTSLKNCVLMLNKDLELVVGVILKLDWNQRDNQVVKCYQSLIVNLVSAHTIYIKACVRMIIRQFMPKVKLVDDDATVDEDTRREDEKSFVHMHNLLRNILKIVPMTPTVLLPLLSDMFPYFTKHSYTQECYVRNLLNITTYLPKERANILELIVDRMTKLDVRSPRQDIIEANEKDEEDEEIKENVFEMDEVDMELEQASQSSVEGGQSGDTEAIKHKEANKLDILMDIMLTYTQVICRPDGEFNWDATKKLYLEYLKIFEKIILPTHASCHVQFLMFYICSFKPELLVEGFLDYLWKKVLDPTKSPVFRQASVAYIASLLARGKFVPMRFVETCLKMFATWCHKYINEACYTTTQPTVAYHGPFYSVCQAIFYVIAFQYKNIFSSQKGYKFAQSLNMQTIVTSRLNPLKICLPVVANTFASIARSHQFAFCDTILERNKRLQLPLAGQNSQADSHLNPLDSFFPFDPYLLTRSSRYIIPLYQEYEGAAVVEEEEEIEEEEFYDEEDVKCRKRSDWDIDVPGSWTDVAKSPSIDLMMYGTSPGFQSM